jgi:hypothetical protein
MPKKFSAKEIEIILVGLQLYKVQLKKMMKSSEAMRVAKDEVKLAFLANEALIGKVNDNKL